MIKANERIGGMKLHFLYGENAHRIPTGLMFVENYPFVMYIMTITKPKNIDGTIEFQTSTFSFGKN